MTLPVLLQSIQPTNILSFGPETPEIVLGPLNLLIGPNGSGKSNLIEVVSLLRSTASDMADTLRRGGGVQEWIWKGKPNAMAWINAIIRPPKDRLPLRHRIAFSAEGQVLRISNEEISDVIDERDDTSVVFHYRLGDTPPIIPQTGGFVGGLGSVSTGIRTDLGSSILRQLRDPIYRPDITYLANQYETIQMYRDWQFGRNAIFRTPQRTDMRTDRLEEDFSNLGLFLNRMRRHPQAKNAILGYLRDIYEGVDDFDVSIEGGTVQVFFTEGDFTIPATRLSDGTLRYLCLLAILCDPTPPPLLCIEEPELGLHPDILPKIADLLVEASTRTQLIVTTHSDILVDAMTEYPESVIVCEKHDGQTQMKHLAKDDLSIWLDKYRLGELWTRGELGGTRW